MATEFDAKIEARILQVFGNGVLEQLQAHKAPLEALKASLAEHMDRGRLHYAMAQIEDLPAKLEGKSGPVVSQMRSFLREQVGSADAESAGLQQAWSGFLAELRRLVDCARFGSGSSTQLPRAGGPFRLRGRIGSLIPF